MQTSTFLAKLIGPLLVAIGVGMLFNNALYQVMAAEFLRSHALIYLSGLLTFLGGLTIVNLHNVWAADWRMVITILGWLALIGGAIRIVVPQAVETIGGAMLARPGVITGAWIVVLALGLGLSFMGYRPNETRTKRGGRK